MSGVGVLRCVGRAAAALTALGAAACTVGHTPEHPAATGRVLLRGELPPAPARSRLAADLLIAGDRIEDGIRAEQRRPERRPGHYWVEGHWRERATRRVTWVPGHWASLDRPFSWTQPASATKPSPQGRDDERF